MLHKTIHRISLLIVLFLLLAAPGYVQEGTQASQASGTTTTSGPELPSFTGFVRFQNDRQLFLNVRRVGYRTVEVQTPGTGSWMQIRLQQLPPDERRRVLRKTLIDEETNPPEVTGIRVTLDGGEVIEGFTEGPNPASSSETERSGSVSGTEQGENTTDGQTSEKQFVVLTSNQGRRELSTSFVQEMEAIPVNPIKMVGAEELYELERRKRNMKDPWDHWKLGKLCMKTKLYEQAANHFQQAGKINSSFRKAVQLRVDILRNWVNSGNAPDSSSTGGDGGETSGGGSGEGG